MEPEVKYRLIDGERYLNDGNYPRAIEEFTGVIKDLKGGPEIARVRNNLAIAYARQGFQEKSIEELKLAVKLDPSHNMAKTNLGIAVCEQSKKYIEEGKVDTAVSLLIGVFELIPENPLPISTLGIICSIQDKKAEAIKLFNKALQLCSSNDKYSAVKKSIEAELNELQKSTS